MSQEDPANAKSTAPTLLAVENLTVEATIRGRMVRPVAGVGFELGAGETLGVVGESGSGKTMTMLSVVGLLPSPPRWRVSGSALFKGADLLSLSPRALRAIRGQDISVIFQNPMTALNPAFRVGWQVAEARSVHAKTPRGDARTAAIEMLERVGLPEPRRRYEQFPHEYSGGMAQRAVTAMALINAPAVIIADEPTTGLDVTIQAQIMELLQDLRRSTGTSLILITHNMSLVMQIADRVMVMYAGRVVESAPVHDILAAPRHPYTVALFRSVPPIDRKLDRLQSIAGTPATADATSVGCPFRPRCPQAGDVCSKEEPKLSVVGPAHTSACHFWREVAFDSGGGRTRG
jgi:oligopeptide transport system ATP-binding protein